MKSKPKCDYCKVLKTVDQKNLEALYHAASGSKALGNCPLDIPEGKTTLQAALKEDSSVVQLYHAVLALKALGVSVDSAKVSQLLLAALKKDDNMVNLGYAFHVASVLGGNLAPFTDRIEDAIVQADEVGSEHLQFEGGLSVTATILSGVYRLAEAAKKAPVVTKEQVLKFANYLLSRKNVQPVKGAALLYDVLKLLATNSYHVPVATSLSGSGALSKAAPTVVVQVTDVLGSPLGPLSVLLNKAIRLLDNQVVMERKPFAPAKEDPSLYVYNFVSNKPRRGFYQLSLNAIPVKADNRLVGNTDAELSVKVLTDVEVVGLEIGTADRDQTAAPKMTPVAFRSKMSQVVEADHHQKLVMKFSLKDVSNGDIMSAHQAFDLFQKAKDMGYLSGKYELSLIIGDAVIANPFKWHLTLNTDDVWSGLVDSNFVTATDTFQEFVDAGESELSVCEEASTDDAIVAAVRGSAEVATDDESDGEDDVDPTPEPDFPCKDALEYLAKASLQLTLPPNPSPPKPTVDMHAPKPEIKHLFREQEKRPPVFLSNAFCGLVLAPLLLLIVLWARIGVNLSNFPFSLSTIVFHLGLAAIFGLFGCFWLRLNMFTTLKYLAGLGAVTFISGHSMLTLLTQKK
ncbi:hypothetical protein HPB50_027529 [Hyalomma asiaticum]|uniref:Uncharacterized protein n=1 Tax=Hyalomma asiaticum TaxID=266040 RepID=A0ACB7SRY4_HYAAI|nr:hypothetical protein HPB50_027529 [Hyalomma asiaticum]